MRASASLPPFAPVFGPVLCRYGQLTRTQPHMPNTNRALNNIYSMRRNRGLLQKQLAALLGHRSSRRVSRYESGNGFPPFQTAMLLEIALGVGLSELYPDLYRECQTLILTRATHLPKQIRRGLVGRLLQEDLPNDHTRAG
jgi:transcriptional regulator with XRE-family HTH domain